MKTIKNTGHLCSIYCPSCGKDTDKVSFNLLREAGRLEAACPVCQEITYLEYDGKKVLLRHHDYDLEQVLRSGKKS
jgi:endogenous inhibitor of DNA gyrase (YacG/DUF329 family)